MKKLLPFLSVLLLVACEKSGEDSITPEHPLAENCVTTKEVNDVVSANYQYRIESINTYNPTTGVLISRQESASTDNSEMAPSGYWELSYNSKGLLEKEEYFRAKGSIFNRYTYEYDANGLCTRVGSSGLQKGEMVETTITTFEYETPTQLKKVEMLIAPFSTPLSYTFEYKNGLMDKVFSFNTYGRLDYITTIEYDDKKKAVTSDSDKGNWRGFPHQHNIEKLTIATMEGAPLNTGSYTATFEYNPEGYPIKETREYADGTHSTKTLNYQCK